MNQPRDSKGRFLPRNSTGSTARKTKKKTAKKNKVLAEPWINSTENPVSTPEPLNHVVFLVDKSLSMACIREDTVRSLNQMIQSVVDNANEFQQTTLVSLVFFSTGNQFSGLHKEEIFWERPTGTITQIAPSQFHPSGNTPLYSAMIDVFSKSVYKKRAAENEAWLLYLLTDGQENQSYSKDKMQFTSWLRQLLERENVSLAVACPPNEVERIKSMGVPVGNIKPWEATTQGTMDLSVSTVASTRNYYTSRSIGRRRTSSFFADVNETKANKLRDLTSDYKMWEVPREMEIRAMVESKNKPYTLGSTYYELVKSEKVQPQKDLLLVDKKTKRIYGGNTREVLGLPAQGDIRLKPGDSGKYWVFVQSTSTNRILGRGSRLLYSQ